MLLFLKIIALVVGFGLPKAGFDLPPAQPKELDPPRLEQRCATQSKETQRLTCELTAALLRRDVAALERLGLPADDAAASLFRRHEIAQIMITGTFTSFRLFSFSTDSGFRWFTSKTVYVGWASSRDGRRMKVSFSPASGAASSETAWLLVEDKVGSTCLFVRGGRNCG